MDYYRVEVRDRRVRVRDGSPFPFVLGVLVAARSKLLISKYNGFDLTYKYSRNDSANLPSHQGHYNYLDDCHYNDSDFDSLNLDYRNGFHLLHLPLEVLLGGLYRRVEWYATEDACIADAEHRIADNEDFRLYLSARAQVLSGDWRVFIPSPERIIGVAAGATSLLKKRHNYRLFFHRRSAIYRESGLFRHTYRVFVVALVVAAGEPTCRAVGCGLSFSVRHL